MATTRTTGTPFAALAIVIAIVGALIFEPGILANTPNGSFQEASNAAATPRSGGHAPVSLGVLGLSDGLLSALAAGSVDASAARAAVPAANAGYPPFGITLPVDLAPYDDAAPPLLGTARDRSGSSTASATPRARASKPAKKPVTRVAVWNVAPIVTWYGPGFYGNKTACGQRYTRYIVGVASRTLPCGTLVQFHWRGITVVAPVIDRGPFATSAYVFDFSARLACDLFRERGQANGCFTRHDVQWRVVGRRRK